MKRAPKIMSAILLSLGLVVFQPLLAYAGEETPPGPYETEDANCLLAGQDMVDTDEAGREDAPGYGGTESEEPSTGEAQDRQGIAGMLPEAEGNAPAEPSVPEQFFEAQAMTVQSGDTVSDEAGLQQWLKDHKETGGTVYLDQTVYITDSFSVYGNAPFTINTGKNGIVFQEDCFFLENTSIVGEGEAVPVLEIAGLNRWTHWNDVLLGMRVTATGNAQGKGGVAVRISMDTAPVDPESFTVRGSVRSYGQGAIGLDILHATDIYCLDIEVSGQNSMAVRAPAGSTLGFSMVRAQEGGICAPNDVFFDTCVSSPNHKNGFNRKITGVKQELYAAARLGDEYSRYALYGLPTVFTLDSPAGGEETAMLLSVEWSEQEMDEIDVSRAGKTAISGSLCPAFAGLGIEENFPIEAVVDIRDPAIPFIESVFYWEDWEQDGAEGFLLYFWEGLDLGTDALRLWRSDDEGKTWSDVSQDDDVAWETHYESTELMFVSICCSEITSPIYLVLEKEGVGDSNTVVILGEDKYALNGGDRTGTDREGGGKDSGGKDDDTNGEETGNPGRPVLVGQPGNAPENNPPSANPPALGSVPDAAAGTVQKGQTSDPSVYSQRSPADRGGETEQSLPLLEWEDETTSVISGRRLAVLTAANPDGVVFIKQGVRIVVDSTAIAALGLADDQLFTLTMEQRDGEVIVRFYVDGQEVFPAYSVDMEEQSGNTAVQNEEQPLSVVTITEAKSPAVATGKANPAIILLPSAGALAILTLFLLRRRRVRP